MKRREFIANAACATASLSLSGCQSFTLGAIAPPTNPSRPNLDVTRHRFGVNYTPSQDWWYSWQNWNIDSIRRDLDAIASVGVDHVRIFPIWPVFQTAAADFSTASFDLLSQLLTEMGTRGLDAVVPVFTGQLSGHYFLPAFNKADPAFYTDNGIWNAQVLYIQKLAALVNAHDNIIGFDFGNEVDTCWSAPLATGDAWMTKIMAAMHSACPGGLHVNGISGSWYCYHTFSPQALAANPLPVMHCYPYWLGSLNYGGPMDPPSTQLLSASAALIRSYAGNVQKPVWAGEYNTCIVSMPETQQAAWLETATMSAIDAGVCWFTYWDSHDLNPKFTDFNAVEYSLGLFTNAGVIKEQGKIYKQIIAAYKGKTVTIPSATLPSPPASLDLNTTWQWLLDFMHWQP